MQNETLALFVSTILTTGYAALHVFPEPFVVSLVYDTHAP
jgi:hypothetical protein